jgi:hypothetical protein
MAFICCDDHNLSIEADGVDQATAGRLMVDDNQPARGPVEQEVKDFGREHRQCNLRILAD